MNYLEEAKRIFSGDIYASEVTGIEIIAAEPGYAKCELKLEVRHRNALGEVMGGVYFTMADYAFAIAANLGGTPTVTQSSQIVFLSGVKGDTLYAETERIKSGRKTCFYKITISDNTGAQNAYITTTGFIL